MLSALKMELLMRKDELKNQTVETIYFGGGTPSLLRAEDIEWLISLIKINYQVSDTAEITLEANPDDLTVERLNDLTATQINRLSIGIQSFFEDDLKSMNRAHNAAEAKQCLAEATKHFNNITIDLIYGIPNMSLDKWHENLQTAFSFGVNHISAYALTVEPKTALDTFVKKGTYPPINEELALQHFEHLVAETAKQGFVQYEISNFGKPQFFSRHNTSYWQGKPYVGIGPSAHSFHGTTRSWNVANNTKYLQNIQANILPSTVEALSVKDQYNEYIMTGLRTIWGVSLNKIEHDFGAEFKAHLLSEAEVFLNQNLLAVTTAKSLQASAQVNEQVLTITDKGKFLADGIASDLFYLN